MSLKTLSVPCAVAVRIAGDVFVGEDFFEQNNDVVHALGAGGAGDARFLLNPEGV